MFDFTPSTSASTEDRYRELCDAAAALIAGEPDPIANMANCAALIWAFVPDLNWAGFYRAMGDELVLGPFIGRPACIRIAMGSGVCGAAAQSGKIQRVDDVRAFAGHIACDPASRSELVVPVIRNGTVGAVLDLDSPLPARFTDADAQGLAMLAERIAPAILA